MSRPSFLQELKRSGVGLFFKKQSPELLTSCSKWAVVFVAACSLHAGMSSQTPSAARAITLFEGARLIAGDGMAPIENSAFIVENDRFTRIARQTHLPRPPPHPP